VKTYDKMGPPFCGGSRPACPDPVDATDFANAVLAADDTDTEALANNLEQWAFGGADAAANQILLSETYTGVDADLLSGSGPFSLLVNGDVIDAQGVVNAAFLAQRRGSGIVAQISAAFAATEQDSIRSAFAMLVLDTLARGRSAYGDDVQASAHASSDAGGGDAVTQGVRAVVGGVYMGAMAASSGARLTVSALRDMFIAVAKHAFIAWEAVSQSWFAMSRHGVPDDVQIAHVGLQSAIRDAIETFEGNADPETEYWQNYYWENDMDSPAPDNSDVEDLLWGWNSVDTEPTTEGTSHNDGHASTQSVSQSGPSPSSPMPAPSEQRRDARGVEWPGPDEQCPWCQEQYGDVPMYKMYCPVDYVRNCAPDTGFPERDPMPVQGEKWTNACNVTDTKAELDRYIAEDAAQAQGDHDPDDPEPVSAVIFPCGHAMHAACLKVVMDTPGNTFQNKCPLCQQKVIKCSTQRGLDMSRERDAADRELAISLQGSSREPSRSTPTARSETPTLDRWRTPQLERLQTPTLERLPTPRLERLQTPTLDRLPTPQLERLQTPVLESLPRAASREQPRVRVRVRGQPNVRVRVQGQPVQVTPWRDTEMEQFRAYLAQETARSNAQSDERVRQEVSRRRAARAQRHSGGRGGAWTVKPIATVVTALLVCISASLG